MAAQLESQTYDGFESALDEFTMFVSLEAFSPSVLCYIYSSGRRDFSEIGRDRTVYLSDEWCATGQANWKLVENGHDDTY
jgi:hypothetical protein